MEKKDKPPPPFCAKPYLRLSYYKQYGYNPCDFGENIASFNP